MRMVYKRYNIPFTFTLYFILRSKIKSPTETVWNSWFGVVVCGLCNPSIYHGQHMCSARVCDACCIRTWEAHGSHNILKTCECWTADTNTDMRWQNAAAVWRERKEKSSRRERRSRKAGNFTSPLSHNITHSSTNTLLHVGINVVSRDGVLMPFGVQPIQHFLYENDVSRSDMSLCVNHV